MGVHGLWRLIEPSGKPVPLETLENKVLAVDISIWLHQAVKGFQDSKGASVPNAHLLGIYHRLCKLLYFRIKPVFVFDGGVPALKKETIAKRTSSKLRNISEADKIQKQLLNTLLKHSAVNKVLAEHIEASMGSVAKTSSRSTKEDMYKLPPNTELDSTISSSEDESYSESTTTDSSPTKNWDLHAIDVNSVHFKSLPIDVRHDILTDLKETRKQSSWGRLHELPKVSDDFSVYQMKRLLKRQAVQAALDDVKKEIGGKTLSLAELESMLTDQGVITNQDVGNRIASDETTKYLLVKDVKKAIEEARKKESLNANPIIIEEDEDANENVTEKSESVTKADLEYEDDLQRAIALSLECEPSTSDDKTRSDQHKEANPTEFSFLENFADADFASSSSEEEETVTKHSKAKMSSAQSYMLEYSGLTPNEIAKIISTEVSSTAPKKLKAKTPSLPVVSEEITSTTEVMEDSVEIMSSTESSDSEDEKKTLNVVINPTTEFNKEDDLFADIFEPEIPKNEETTFDKGDLVVQEIVRHSKEPLETIAEESLKSTNDDSINEITDVIVTDCNKSGEEKNLDAVQEVTSTVVQENAATDEPQKSILLNQNYKQSIPSNRSQENDKVKNDAQKPSISKQDLKDLKEQLQRDKVDLINEKSAKERMAGNITDQMYQEAQELLELFGVPYVVAPMEAEAQCAFLDAIELTDGTITDDSDIWLFGGRTVYKNFFNQSKYVMEYRSENINHHFKLTREQMILLALLVGSDYTVGLQGVGPVTAMEILAAFPPSKGKVKEFNLSHSDLLSGLKEFRSWFTKGKSPGPGRSSLKSKLKNMSFTENFPSLQVIQAYLDPTVETSRDAFSWKRPNALALREFAREKFGWTRTKTEEILNPVLKKLEDITHQKTIRDYFKTRFRVHSDEAEKKMSKRVKHAIKNMGRDPSEVLAEELEEELKKQPKKRAQRKKEGTEAPEFSKASRNPPKTDEELTESKNTKKVDNTKKKRTNKVSLEKLKPADSSSSTSQVDDAKNTAAEPSGVDEHADISQKINLIASRKPPKTDKELTESKNTKKVDNTKKKRTSKLSLEKLKPADSSSSTSQVDDAKNTAAEPSEVDEHADISQKINLIRRRRKLKEAKAAVDIKKPKLPKEKTLPNEFSEIIPNELAVDEEVNLLSQIVAQSGEKVEEINRTMQEKLENMQTKSLEVFAPSSSTASPRKPPLSTRRPAFRPTRVPRKELIPQKEKDKSAVLRNKLKAIEVYRKGKKGPGYIPKRERKTRLLKAEAELSESSDE